GERGYFGMLSVDPARQKEGLGRRLVEIAEQRCRDAGCRIMELHAVNLRPELLPYYRRLGYVESGTAPFTSERLKQPAHFIIMEKPLDHPLDHLLARLRSRFGSQVIVREKTDERITLQIGSDEDSILGLRIVDRLRPSFAASYPALRIGRDGSRQV